MLWLIAMTVLVATSIWQYRRREIVPRQIWIAWWILPAVAAVVAGIVWPEWMLIRKTIGYLLMPAGLLWLILFLLAWWARYERGLCAGIVVFLLLYTVAGNVCLSGRLLGSLEAPFHDQDPLAQAPFDVVCVLGGDADLSPTGRPMLGSSGDRIWLGAEMQRRGLTACLVASGQSIEGLSPDCDLAENTRQIWLAMGIPDAVIRKADHARTTDEEIRAYKILAASTGWKRIGLITSAWHLPRAVAAARRHGLEVVPLPADFIGERLPLSAPNCIPQGKGFYRLHRALWEWIGRWTGN